MLYKYLKLFFLIITIPCFSQVKKIDSINYKITQLIDSSIIKKAFPGAQIYLKIGNSIVINESFGFHTYDSIIKVENDHIYDLASLTKVFGPTYALMKIFDFSFKIALFGAFLLFSGDSHHKLWPKIELGGCIISSFI